MIEDFIKQIFTSHVYTAELTCLYIVSGIFAGLTRLTIRDGSKVQFKSWWNDGSLLGAIIISVAGALLFDNNFIWSFLGGYFIVYILDFIQKKLEKEGKNDTTTTS